MKKRQPWLYGFIGIVVLLRRSRTGKSDAAALSMFNSLIGNDPMASGLRGLRKRTVQDLILKIVPDGGTTVNLLDLAMIGLDGLLREFGG